MPPDRLRLSEGQSDVAPYIHGMNTVGLRRSFAKDGVPIAITYKMLASKQTEEWDEIAGQWVATIGRVKKISLAIFAGWAKGVVPPSELEEHLLRLAGAKDSGS